MKTVACAVFALGAAPLGEAASVVVRKAASVSVIEPTLEPETHKEWEKDYPKDVSHSTELDVKFPYPQVQASHAFDKDYVKDENNNKMDKKAWDDQLKHAKAVSDAAEDVDKLKNKLSDMEKALEEAKKKDAEESQEYDDAKKKEDALGDGTKEFEGKDSGNADGDGVKVATDGVEKEMSDLEKCKEQLRVAKEKLAKLNEAAEAAHLADTKKEDVKVAAVNFERVADEQHEAAEKHLLEEEEEHEKAVKTHKEEVEKLDVMEADLKKAEEKLKSFRGGGSSSPEAARSGAVPLAKSTVLASAVVIAAMLYTSVA